MARCIRSMAAALILLASPLLLAQRLPITSFSAADGLPGGGVSRIIRDAHGFMWFGSTEGLARFDGHAFVRFGAELGLPSLVVYDLLQTRDGCYWFATSQGLCRLDAASARGQEGSGKLKVLAVAGGQAAPFRLLEDPAGVLWCGTNRGLFRVDRNPGHEALQPVDLGLPTRLWDDPIVSALAARAEGGLWIGTGSGLYALEPTGRVLRFTDADGLPSRMIRSLASEPDGTLWVATSKGVAKLRLPAATASLQDLRIFSAADGLASADIQVLLVSGPGRVLAGTALGLSILEHGRIKNLGPDQGIKGPVFVLAENANGDLWLGNESGVQRWRRDGLTTFTQRDGLAQARVDALLEDSAGNLVAGRADSQTYWLHSLRGDRFTQASLPRGPLTPGWGWNQAMLQDHLGAWWMATGQGLAQFPSTPGPAEAVLARPPRLHKVAPAAGADSVFALFEDSRGDIWFSVASPVTNGLGRWRRETNRVEGFREQDGLPRLFNSLATAFAEDQAGQVWVAFNGAGLARFRDGRFERFGAAQGVPEGWIRSLLKDAAGRLWVATSVGGLGLVEDPTAAQPRIRALTTAQGLASNSVWSVTEDRWGRIYAGTGAGIDRLDLAHGRVFHLSAAQGLAAGLPRAAFRDREGNLWFGMSEGLSRYVPTPPGPAHAPPIYMTGLRVAGSPRPLPESGVSDWQLADLPHAQNRIQVDFTSPEGPGGSALLYQYRLEGVSNDWTPPDAARSVDLANLAPGLYHFQVRAIGEEGAASNPPAELRFTILAPLWRRGWFLTLAAGGLLGLAWLAYRYRLQNLLAVERIRTRIAADLHDDIGASLSRIAILSEVVKRRTPEDQPETSRFLSEIADSSRELVDSMSEIVWSIDPRRDDLKHCLARVGQFAAGVVEAKEIRWTIQLPEDPARIKLTPEQRRGLYLILKEAINNAVKHSGCRSLHLQVTVAQGVIAAQVRDDGAGMPAQPPSGDTSASRRGRGLVNMQARAREMGGRLRIDSGSAGTVVRLEAPLRTRGA